MPGKFLVEGITDDQFPGSIGSALLKMVTIGDSVIIMAGAAGPLRAVRNFADDGEGTSI